MDSNYIIQELDFSRSQKKLIKEFNKQQLRICRDSIKSIESFSYRMHNMSISKPFTSDFIKRITTFVEQAEIAPTIEFIPTVPCVCCNYTNTQNGSKLSFEFYSRGQLVFRKYISPSTNYFQTEILHVGNNYDIINNYIRAFYLYDPKDGFMEGDIVRFYDRELYVNRAYDILTGKKVTNEPVVMPSTRGLYVIDRIKVNAINTSLLNSTMILYRSLLDGSSNVETEQDFYSTTPILSVSSNSRIKQNKRFILEYRPYRVSRNSINGIYMEI